VQQTRVCITVYAKKGRDVPLAHVNCCLFDFKNHFRSGELVLNMWPDAKANPIGTCVQNLRPPTADSGPPARIRLAFPTFPQPVVFPNIPAAAGTLLDLALLPLCLRCANELRCSRSRDTRSCSCAERSNASAIGDAGRLRYVPLLWAVSVTALLLTSLDLSLSLSLVVQTNCTACRQMTRFCCGSIASIVVTT